MTTTQCLNLTAGTSPRQRARPAKSVLGGSRLGTHPARGRSSLSSIKGQLSAEPEKFVESNTETSGE